MENGTITRAMAAVFDGLGEEFGAMYVAGDFRRKVAQLQTAKSERRQILGELYTMFDECGIPYEQNQGNSYYQKLVDTVELPHFTDVEDRILWALYQRHREFLSPSQYMERIVNRLENPKDGWRNDTLRLRILKQFIKYGNYLSDMTELRTGKNGKVTEVPKAGGRAAIEAYVRQKTGLEPDVETVLANLDDGVFDRLEETIANARKLSEQKISAAVNAFVTVGSLKCGKNLTPGQTAVLLDGQKMKRMEADLRRSRQEQQMRQFAAVWQAAVSAEPHSGAIAALLDSIAQKKKAQRGKKTITVSPALAAKRQSDLEKARQALVDYAKAELGLELTEEQMTLILSPRKWKTMEEQLAAAPGEPDLAQQWDSILSSVEDAPRADTLEMLLRWIDRQLQQDAGIAAAMENVRKARDYAHEIRQTATAMDGPVGLLRMVDDLARGMFREGGTTRRSLYLFAMVYNMTFYTGARDAIRRDTDVEKNLFRDYYSNSMMRYLSESFREKRSETELDPPGQGINYKNFAEMCYLYYISQPDLTAAEKIQKSTRMIQRLRESQRGAARTAQADLGTAYFRGRVLRTQGVKHLFIEDLFAQSEQEFEAFLSQNYDCNTQRGYAMGVLDLETEQNTAFENYQEILERLKEILRESGVEPGEELEVCNYGLCFADVGAYKKDRFADGGADEGQLESFRTLLEEFQRRHGAGRDRDARQADQAQYESFMELLLGVNRLLGRTVSERVSYQSVAEERTEQSHHVIKALSVTSPRRMTRSSMIVAYYYYYNALREEKRTEELRSFRAFYQDFTEELDDYLVDSNYLPMSSKNIFDVLVAFSAFAYYSIG